MHPDSTKANLGAWNVSNVIPARSRTLKDRHGVKLVSLDVTQNSLEWRNAPSVGQVSITCKQRKLRVLHVSVWNVLKDGSAKRRNRSFVMLVHPVSTVVSTFRALVSFFAKMVNIVFCKMVNIVFFGVDHRCCWVKLAPQSLSNFSFPPDTMITSNHRKVRGFARTCRVQNLCTRTVPRPIWECEVQGA